MDNKTFVTLRWIAVFGNIKISQNFCKTLEENNQFIYISFCLSTTTNVALRYS